MRYMRAGHRREWLENTFRMILKNLLPGLVRLLNVRFKHMLRLIGKSPPLPVTSAPSPLLHVSHTKALPFFQLSTKQSSRASLPVLRRMV